MNDCCATSCASFVMLYLLLYPGYVLLFAGLFKIPLIVLSDLKSISSPIPPILFLSRNLAWMEIVESVTNVELNVDFGLNI